MAIIDKQLKEFEALGYSYTVHEEKAKDGLIHFTCVVSFYGGVIGKTQKWAKIRRAKINAKNIMVTHQLRKK